MTTRRPEGCGTLLNEEEEPMFAPGNGGGCGKKVSGWIWDTTAKKRRTIPTGRSDHQKEERERDPLRRKIWAFGKRAIQ